MSIYRPLQLYETVRIKTTDHLYSRLIHVPSFQDALKNAHSYSDLFNYATVMNTAEYKNSSILKGRLATVYVIIDFYDHIANRMEVNLLWVHSLQRWAIFDVYAWTTDYAGSPNQGNESVKTRVEESEEQYKEENEHQRMMRFFFR